MWNVPVMSNSVPNFPVKNFPVNSQNDPVSKRPTKKSTPKYVGSFDVPVQTQ